MPATLDAGGFDRHTFLCGQSGSGKTYSLGLILERLLVETDLRLIILDPNSDYVRLGEQRADADAELATGYADAAQGVVSRRAGEGLHIPLGQLDPRARAAALELDPVADREEFALVDELLAGGRRGLRGPGDLGPSHTRGHFAYAPRTSAFRTGTFGRAAGRGR